MVFFGLESSKRLVLRGVRVALRTDARSCGAEPLSAADARICADELRETVRRHRRARAARAIRCVWSWPDLPLTKDWRFPFKLL
jgi:hypothetical protein